MAFEVIVLGASGTYPTPASACSGYLLRAEDKELWLDAGTGTFANLQRHTNFLQLEAMVLSHLHLDHILDLYPFYFALRFWPTEPKGFPIYAPAGAEALLTHMFSTSPDKEFQDFGGYLEFRTIESGGTLDIGPFHFEFQRTVHPIECLAMRITAEGRTLVYTSDTAPSKDVTEFAKGAHVLLTEATLDEPDPNLALVHMTAEEAGEMAGSAAVGRLILTHVWPQYDAELIAKKARKAFGGET
ncbi:MAG: MBL fold metallo-hydrolase, partial [Acidimicrobiia bacterium]